MSRIGKLAIKLPEQVSLRGPADDIVYVKGPKGELSQYIDPAIQVSVQENNITLHRKTEQKRHKALHGLYRALIHNMVVGVSQGFSKTLELVGVGYKANVQGNLLDLDLGYSHKVYFIFPLELTLQAEISKSKNPIIQISGIDKSLVGQVASKIKKLRAVEPYKGKGIRYLGEQVRRKAGKKAAK
jgi:large subunit ribosomal protein L6